MIRYWLILPFVLLVVAHLEASLFYQNWSSTAKTTFLQARLGSRFSFSPSLGHRGIYSGTIGMDNDDLRQWLFQINNKGLKYQFSSAALLPGNKLVDQEEVGMHNLQTEFRGKAGEILASWNQFSAWKKFDKLEDTAAMMFSTAPFYAWQLELANTGKETQTVEVTLAQNSIPIDPDKGVNLSWWRLNQPTQRLYFRDPSSKGMTALSVPAQEKGILVELSGFYGLKFTLSLQPGETRRIPLVWAGYTSEPVVRDEKHNQDLRFAYTQFFSGIDQVSDYGIKNHEAAITSSEAFQADFDRKRGTSEEKWLAVLNFRTDLANGFLLKNQQGKMVWLETEGRFRHLNTLDVAMETQLLAKLMPWRLKLMLEMWASYIALHEIQVPSTRNRTGIKTNIEGASASETGPYVFHDVGNFPFVMVGEGYDFGPYLPVEENTNFILMLYWYGHISGDLNFIKKYAGLVAVLMQSLQNRDSNGNGLADVGHGWSTYDVSEAIKRAPDNTYHAVKMFSAYLLGSRLLMQSIVSPLRSIDQSLKTTDQDGTTMNGNQKTEWERGTIGNAVFRNRQIAFFESEARKILVSLEKAQKKHGFIPVSLDEKFPGWNQQISVLGEGLLYPLLCQFQHPLLESMKKILRPEWKKALKLCTREYGLLISSSEPTTWFSKTFVADYVARKAFGFTGTHARYAYNWNLNNDQAFQDGANSPTEPWPGNWYPRGLSAWLYLED